MDNITHSLVGVALGEAILHARVPREQRATPQGWMLRAGVLWACVAGSNLPDADFVIRSLAPEGDLAYLLHHRGFTHTLIFAPLTALVAALIGRVAIGKKAIEGAWPLLYLAGIVGVLGHVFADFWNDYGVHPLWPFMNGWFYGDFIFIAEPLLWAALLPFAYLSARTRVARGVLIVIAALGLGLSWLGPFTTWPVALGITLWGAMVFATQKKWETPWVALVSGLSVLVAFSMASREAKTLITNAVPTGEKILGIESSPAPANPFCWRVIVSSVQGDAYLARMGVVSLAPASWGEKWPFASSGLCMARAWGAHTAPFSPVRAESLLALAPRVMWAGVFEGGVSEYQRLLRTHCRFKALMTFARMPFWTHLDPQTVLAGDLRYDREAGRGFTEIISRETDACPAWMPQWDPPSGL